MRITLYNAYKVFISFSENYGFAQKNSADYLLNFYNTYDTGKGVFFLNLFQMVNSEW